MKIKPTFKTSKSGAFLPNKYPASFFQRLENYRSKLFPVTETNESFNIVNKKHEILNVKPIVSNQRPLTSVKRKALRTDAGTSPVKDLVNFPLTTERPTVSSPESSLKARIIIPRHTNSEGKNTRLRRIGSAKANTINYRIFEIYTRFPMRSIRLKRQFGLNFGIQTAK